MELGVTIAVQSGIFLILDLYVLGKTYRERRVNDKHRYFTRLALSTSVFQFASFLVRLVKNRLFYCGILTQYIIYILMFVAMVITAWGAMCYLLHLCELKIRTTPGLRLIVFIPCALISVSVLLSPWTHWFFFLDSDLNYHRGSLFFLQIIGPGIYTLATLALIIGVYIKDKKRNVRQILRYLICFIMPTLCGMIMQIVLNVDGGYSAIGVSVCVILLYMEFYIDEIKGIEILKEQQSKADLIQGVAGVYRFAFSFDMRGSYFKVIQMDDKIKHLFKNAEVTSFDEAIPPLFELLHPADKDRMSRELNFDVIREKLKENFSYDVEYRVVIKGGTEWHEMNVTRINNDEVAMGFKEKDLEITKRHIEENRFREYFGLYEADIDAGMLKVLIDSPYYTFSETLEPVPYTAAMKKFAENQKGETKEYFLNLSDMEWVKKILANDDRHSFEYYSVTAGNTWVDVTCYVTMRNDDGSPAMFALGYSFVSSTGAARQDMIKKELEQQKKLEEALEMAEVANKAKTDFLFNMSHDIRTPMNAILGFTNIARKEINNPEKALDSLEKVRRSSDILLNLINDVLDMSRIESGKVELYEDKYDIDEAFDSIEPAMANLAASKDIDLQFSIGNVWDRHVFVDGSRFDRVLINIISNAIKYTPAEGFVKVSAEQIEGAEPGYGIFRFKVADSGIGMSEEFQKHMFEDFTREENSTTRGVQGTGLGLALAKKLVDMMGGTISCISAQGVGTTFTLDFPLRLQTEADIAEKTEEKQEQIHIDLRGKKVLLVEDNELNREIADDMLLEEGIIVETAIDGQKAVNKIREQGADYYDFILMDIQMPVMNGYEATKAIHKLMPEFKVPIIALSANVFQEDRERSKEAGMDGHVAKPINMDELFGVLDKLIS